MLQAVRGSIKHNSLGLSTSIKDLQCSRTNIIHACRPLTLKQQHVFALEAQELGVGFRQRVTVNTSDPGPGTAQLLQQVTGPATYAALQQDVQQLAELYGQAYDAPVVNVKIDVLDAAVCPKWHADSVACRLLITYCGPGTYYVENRHVKRRWHWPDGVAAVESVDEHYAQQTRPGDILVLKGHDYDGGSYNGCGAVHKSPELNTDLDLDRDSVGARADVGSSLRLLLTIDDVLMTDACRCGQEHVH